MAARKEHLQHVLIGWETLFRMMLETLGNVFCCHVNLSMSFLHYISP